MGPDRGTGVQADIPRFPKEDSGAPPGRVLAPDDIPAIMQVHRRIPAPMPGMRCLETRTEKFMVGSVLMIAGVRLRRLAFEWASSSVETGVTLALVALLSGLLLLDLPPPMVELPAVIGWIPVGLAAVCFIAALAFIAAAYDGYRHQRRAQF